MTVKGYVRVSTKEQNTERQTQALAMCSTIYIDRLSGKDTERPELQRMMSEAEAGDVIMVKSVDRLARNTKDLLTILDELLERGVSVRFIDTQMEFSDNPVSRFMITMLGAVGTLERDFIKQRQAEGVAIAKTNGVYKGRSKNESLRTDVRAMLADGVKPAAVAEALGCGVATVFRIKKEEN
ncbi:recombinase family protein [Erwinia billingiae]|uniref:recombinase family protein n=1 Tax=Erwinia billingiae TaxID=182337 RepID=UPI00320A9EE0